eukprot:9467231-Pyramimonas_sp.AAC.1
MHALVDTERRLSDSTEEELEKRRTGTRGQQGSVNTQHKRARVQITKVGRLRKGGKDEMWDGQPAW